MVLCALIATAVLATAGEPTAQPPQSILDQLGVKYTGLNGMEDYLVAAELARGPKHAKLIGFVQTYLRPKMTPRERKEFFSGVAFPPGLNQDSTILDAYKAVRTSSAPIFEALKKGNSKAMSPIQLPGPDSEDQFLVYGGYRHVMYSVSWSLEADMADGNSASAVSLAETYSRFTRRLPHENLIDILWNVALEPIPFQCFGTHIQRFSVADHKRIRALAQEALEAFPNLHRTFLGELKFQRESFGKAKSWAEVDVLPDEHEPELEEADIRATLERFSLATVRTLFVEEGESYLGELESVLALPEDRQSTAIKLMIARYKRTWPPVSARDIAMNMMKSNSDAILSVHQLVLRLRARYRLLLLHTLVEEYRWQHDALPDNLSDCASPALCHDPLSGKPFEYKKSGSATYELFSAGGEDGRRIKLSGRDDADSLPGDEAPGP